MQIEIDCGLRKHVAPGYGGISQEMWIAAPPPIRAHERRIISLVLSTGLVPSILLRKQMVFLPKTAAVDTTLRLSAGLPPWRPITVQSSLASRLQLVIKRYADRRVENCKMQHGFQHTRTVQDASLLTGLLVERAHELKRACFWYPRTV
ncbi:hypothetical protein PHYSODRAFT_488058 [Phytophthora sojae]|uniref:Reverse transcriptase domain-containing protein n=1 Tax=Phytophthora sojae (strain P6497) TaxID=1094619 RepID=G4Z6K1_PHYSP|nr:hypothetical protein PHYSODRAFT_488058 [Phytophthora sojae]EGZ19571.1 hypothetical protein PHYSODRAFT_488058 [Phytophthora sojae]|eukprot:XP_009522288.1 hypothetical protein PHYSODRAFT_488058 [Phytophthora sojae]